MLSVITKYWSSGIKRTLLNLWRKPLSGYLRKVESQIPKYELSPEHLRHTQLLSNRSEMLKRFPRGGIVAELGVDTGNFSEQILRICEPGKFHLVDFWGSKRYHQGKRDFVFERFSEQIQEERIVIHLGLSTKVSDQFADNYFDWIYIDTDHTYRTTIQELEQYAAKVKPDGIIAGHDYETGNWTGIRRYGVIEAVHEFCVKNRWELVYLTTEIGDPRSFAIRRMSAAKS